VNEQARLMIREQVAAFERECDDISERNGKLMCAYCFTDDMHVC
jgi:hypothetical protein